MERDVLRVILYAVLVFSGIGLILSGLEGWHDFGIRSTVFTLAAVGLAITAGGSRPAGHPSKERGRPD